MKVQTLNDISEVDPKAWDGLTDANFPFADYAYLSALQSSGSVGEGTGWLPRYIVVNDERGTLVGATFYYIKNHSYGEYIFDWEWARAFGQHGVPYYPKLVSAVPFTPATGSKLLTRDDRVRPILVAALTGAMAHEGQSLHALFIPESEIEIYRAAGCLIRDSFQYHWKNDPAGYASFEDFLGRLKSRKRKQIVKERASIEEAALRIVEYSGETISRSCAREFYPLYLSTVDKMGAIPYLTESFFETVFAEMADRIFLVVAEREGHWIAAALNYFKGDAIYGRYWGCREEIRNLHFELCYYRPIDFAIRRKFARVEAGAQGEHKIARGYLPTRTFSAHEIKHPQFRAAIAEFVERERGMIGDVFLQLNADSPFQVESTSLK